MKKLFLTMFLILFFVSIANAGCRLGANWTPDPSGAATSQELWYNPDGIADNGDEIMGQSFPSGAATGNFLVETDIFSGLTISERPYLDSVEMGKVIRHDGRSRYRF